ncbi:MAG TPA: family 43 glycosylhydrolase [bacterium]|nr:family 43 glycosylhydrolase [bacterium]
MNRALPLLLLFGLFLFGVAVRRVHAVENPVLPSVADSGVMKHRGEYYLMGVGTNGHIYISDDLIQWKGTYPAMTMKNAWARGGAATDWQIHACDLNYVNGVFHLYWSVNYLDADLDIRQIGHSVAVEPLGPYIEPVTETWFDGRIDPQLFVDDDGAPYFYKVLFEHGNVIYGERLKDPWTHGDDPKRLLSTLEGTWEQLDPQGYLVNEAPWVFKYRNKYYMLYGANHVGLGHYAIGCAQADSPMGFSNATKYPHAVLDSKIISVGSDLSGSKQEFRIHNCGQPSVVRGPNGFEWWVVYFAKYNESASSQAVDRVLFFDRELFIDGPSTTNTPGYHPNPSLPTFRDLFCEDQQQSLAERWQLACGQWVSCDGLLQQQATAGGAMAIVKSTPARNYLFEASIKLSTGKGTAGVIAYWHDSENWLSLCLDRKNQGWFAERMEQGSLTLERHELPSTFNFDVFHTIRVCHNADTFEVQIDGIGAGDVWTVRTSFDKTGLPALCTKDTSALFDGVTYTIGWDEFDSTIRGWGDALCGHEAAGNWNVTERGLTQNDRDSHACVYKGDLVDEYEFMTQVSFAEAAESDTYAAAGIYAVYVDASNWLSAVVERPSQDLVIRGQILGDPVREIRVPKSLEDSFNLRTIKMRDKVILFVDGVLGATVETAFPASQVGLLTENCEVVFNGITCFDKSKR